MADTPDPELVKTNDKLKEKLLRWMPEEGRFPTTIEGLIISRRDDMEELENCFYTPTIGIVVQGHKRSLIGNEEYRYGQYSGIAVGVDMPSVNHITRASKQEPFLAVSLKLDRYMITRLLTELPQTQAGIGSSKGVAVAPVESEILSAFLRLVDLMDKPEQIPVLAPMLIREIHFRSLLGPYGECLRMVSTTGSQSHQIAQAISWLRENYRSPLIIEELSSRVNMAPSTFHRHFRKVTSMSPLQFQKRLRLYEAQRLMLTNNLDTATASLEVGYESPTQFNREYKRLFGEPPHRDISKLKKIGTVSTVQKGREMAIPGI